MIDHHVGKIVRESVGILVVASIISTFGGIGIEALSSKLVWLLPVIILLPSLNDMIGDFGSIIASRFTMMLFKKEVSEKNLWKRNHVHHLFFVSVGIAICTAVYVSVLAYFIASVMGFPFDKLVFQKVIFIAMITTVFLILLLFFMSIIGGLYVYRRKHDPDNYLIPLTTAIADFGSMILLALLVAWLF